MTDTPPPARYYRVRMEFRRPLVRLYADHTVSECVGTLGPFADMEAAKAAGEATGLINGDE